MLRISVIIATCNRCKSLKKTLDSLLQQQMVNSKEYEVLVVDNNSKDTTKETVYTYQATTSIPICYIFEPIQGKSYALNSGVKAARGDIIAFIDDDAIADKKWLAYTLRCFQDKGCDAMGGRILPIYPANTHGWIKKHSTLLAGPIVCYDYGDGTLAYNKKTMQPFVGTNTAVKQNCFAEIGFFRVDLGPGTGTFGDDSEFIARLQTANKKVIYCGNALVYHRTERARMSYAYFAKWWIGEGRFCAIIDYDSAKPMKRVFGFPRYLLLEIVKSVWACIISLGSREEFLKCWFRLYLQIGKGYEYRILYQENGN